MMIFSYHDVVRASARIKDVVHRTPVFTSEYLNGFTGRQLFFKAETLQKTGSFKARGACNAVLQALEDDPETKGFVTHSSGNHGQAVAYAAKCVGKPCAVVVPKGTPFAKTAAIQTYGADLFLCEPTPTARRETCQRIADKHGYQIVHPFDDYRVMAGQGTIALEFLQDHPDLDAILVPISGGGMASGIAMAARAMSSKCRVFLVEPLGKDLEPSLRAQVRLWPDHSPFLTTIADALRMPEPGQLTFPILCEKAEPVVFSISDEEMVRGMRVGFERLKLVVEAASGAAIAAACSQKLKEFDPSVRNVGVILCGGNVDLSNLPF